MTSNALKIAALAAFCSLSTQAFADGHEAGDPEKGAKVFKKCAACHDDSEAAKKKVGPPLFGVVGRKVASFDGYKYGKSIVAWGETGAVWSEEELMAYLTHPRNYLREKLDDKKAKSKMPLKLKKAEDRANVVAYLKSLSKAE